MKKRSSWFLFLSFFFFQVMCLCVCTCKRERDRERSLGVSSPIQWVVVIRPPNLTPSVCLPAELSDLPSISIYFLSVISEMLYVYSFLLFYTRLFYSFLFCFSVFIYTLYNCRSFISKIYVVLVNTPISFPNFFPPEHCVIICF